MKHYTFIPETGADFRPSISLHHRRDETKDDILELDRQLNAERATFNVTRSRLASVLAVSMAREGAEDIFISKAYEFGVEYALDASATDPDYFELSWSPHQGTLTKFNEPLTDVLTSCHRMDEIVRRRERLPSMKWGTSWTGSLHRSVLPIPNTDQTALRADKARRNVERETSR